MACCILKVRANLVRHSFCALILLVGVHLVPERLAAAGLGTQAAMEYIAYGIESAALWLAIFLGCGWLREVGQRVGRVDDIMGAATILRYASAWGGAEGAERAGCRAALPLDRAPLLQPGQTLCDAAFGWPVSLLSLAAALLLAAYLNHRGASR